MATQNAYPDSDEDAGSWDRYDMYGDDLFEAVDESGTANNSDYILTTDHGAGPTSANTVKFTLGNTVTDPGEDAGHKIIYTARLSDGSGRPLTVALYEGDGSGGGDLIEAAVTGTGLPALTGSFVTNTFTISNGAANGIGTYNNLEIWLTAAAAGSDDMVEVSQVYFEHEPSPAIILSGVAAKSHVLGMFD